MNIAYSAIFTVQRLIYDIILIRDSLLFDGLPIILNYRRGET